MTYTRGDQLYELQEPHFGRQLKEDPCISKTKYFHIFMVFFCSFKHSRFVSVRCGFSVFRKLLKTRVCVSACVRAGGGGTLGIC